MDTIAIAVCDDHDSALIADLLQVLELSEPQSNFLNDEEVRPGLERFCKAKRITYLHFLAKSPLDSSSNRLAQEVAIDLGQGKLSRLDLLAQKIESNPPTREIYFIFASNWNVADEIIYLTGGASAFHQYMEQNGGAYRCLYVVDRDQYNIDLDTPVVWKMVAEPRS